MRRRLLIHLCLLVLAAVTVLYFVDSAVFLAATHHGWRLVPDVVNKHDVCWWRARVGALPPVTNGPIDPPPAVAGRPGAWYYRGGGHGGAGASSIPPTGPQRLIAYTIAPQPLIPSLSPLIQGRALASSDDQSGFRIGVALPMVMRERSYLGSSRTFVPNPLDRGWHERIRPVGVAVNALIMIAIFGWPIYLWDMRMLLRICRGKCAKCGYDLRGLEDRRCPECGTSAHTARKVPKSMPR